MRQSVMPNTTGTRRTKITTMQGIDPYAYLQQVALKLNKLDSRESVETALDEIEYLYEVMDPELQPLAEQVMDQLRLKIREFS